MTTFRQTRQESWDMKDKITLAVEKEPLKYSDLYAMFNFDTRYQLNNHIMQLKRFGVIEWLPADSSMHVTQRRYQRVEGSRLFSEIVKEREPSGRKSIKREAPIELSPYGRLVHLTDSHHTRGNKHRVSAWQGYSANGGM